MGSAQVVPRWDRGTMAMVGIVTGRKQSQPAPEREAKTRLATAEALLWVSGTPVGCSAGGKGFAQGGSPWQGLREGSIRLCCEMWLPGTRVLPPPSLPSSSSRAGSAQRCSSAARGSATHLPEIENGGKCVLVHGTYPERPLMCGKMSVSYRSLSSPRSLPPSRPVLTPGPDPVLGFIILQVLLGREESWSRAPRRACPPEHVSCSWKHSQEEFSPSASVLGAPSWSAERNSSA